jgi:hypothetical protein
VNERLGSGPLPNVVWELDYYLSDRERVAQIISKRQ